MMCSKHCSTSYAWLHRLQLELRSTAVQWSDEESCRSQRGWGAPIRGSDTELCGSACPLLSRWVEMYLRSTAGVLSRNPPRKQVSAPIRPLTPGLSPTSPNMTQGQTGKSGSGWPPCPEYQALSVSQRDRPCRSGVLHQGRTAVPRLLSPGSPGYSRTIPSVPANPAWHPHSTYRDTEGGFKL